MSTRNLAANALAAALYVVVTSVWGWAATGPALNIRLATALYVLPAGDPALLLGPALGNGLSTLITGGHLLDAGLGVIVGLLSGWAAGLLARKWTVAASPLAVLLVPTATVPLWVAWLYHAPLNVTFGSVAAGQALSAAAAWIIVLPAARRVLRQT